MNEADGPTLFIPRWLRYRRWRLGVLAASAVLAALSLPGLLRLETDNSPEVFFVRGSEDAERYRAFRDEFGSDLIVRLVARGDGLWTSAGLRWLSELEEQVGGMEGVESASGLYRHHRRSGWPTTAEAVDDFRRRVLANDLDRALGWVSADGSTVTVMVVLDDVGAGRDRPAEQRRLLARLQQALADPPADVTAELAGPPLLNQALDASSREIEYRYFPLLVAFSVVLLRLTLGGGVGFLKPLVFVGLCELLALAPMGWAGVELNLVLAVLPPLLFAIALATALHLLLRFRDLRAELPTGADPVDACLATYGDKGWSILWTGLTTLIAFASLTLSPVAPVRGLGGWAALALALMTAAAFVAYPVLLTLPLPAARRPPVFERAFRELGLRWGRWAGRRHPWVLVAAAVLAIFAAAGWPRIRVQSNALHYLAVDHPVRAQFERLQSQGIGLAAIEVLVAPPGEAPFADAQQIARLADLGDRLEEEPLIYGASSAGLLLRDTAARFPAPLLGAGNHLALVLRGLEADPEGHHALDRSLSADRRRARITVFLATVGLDELEPLLDSVRGRTLATFPNAEVEITGELPLLLEAQRYLLSTLALSLALTLIAVAVVLRLVLPGTRLALLALLPNLWPVVGILGVMGWLDVPVDVATVMVASVVLGLAVDDTLHTLGHFRQLAPRIGAREAIARTLEITAPAYVLTGVILAAGFGVCALSDFAPLARFGSLSAFAIALAVLGDLFLLPALLGLTPRSTVGRWRGRPDKLQPS